MTSTNAVSEHSEAAVASQVSDLVAARGWYTLAFMVAVTMFAFVDRQILTLAAAPLAQSLELSNSQLGAVQGLAFALFGLIAVYPIAWIADRLDRRVILAACIIVWSLGTAACGLAQNYEQLFIAAVCIAAGEAGLSPILLSTIPDLFSGRMRALANSLFYFFSILGVSLGLMLGGLAIGALDAVHHDLSPWLRQFESWRLAFFAVALPAPLFLIMLAFARIRRPTIQTGTVKASQPTAYFPFLQKHWRPILSIFASLGLYTAAFSGYVIWLPVAMARLFQVTPAQNGYGMGVALSAGMLAGVTAGTVLMRRYSTIWGKVAPLRLSWIVMTIMTPVVMAFPFIQASWQGYALIGVMMLAGSIAGSLIPNILQDMAPGPLRTRFMAIYMILQTLLGGAAPAFVGWVSDLINAESPILTAITMVSLPAMICASLLLRKSERAFQSLTVTVAELEADLSIAHQLSSKA
ncbi:MFS transporter [Aquisediminimonas profunda]|uniref:MFS transporter n=1 Tax=Aquisediminimonas profunda TaxID=1550733 RepID=UPI001C62CE14|nr:MFS transporter [Aquisediminimonas profunda]